MYVCISQTPFIADINSTS